MIPVMDFAADLAPIYDTLGVPVTHTPAAGGTPTTAQAMHNLPSTQWFAGELVATDHHLRYPAANFPEIHKGDVLVIAAVTYHALDNAQPINDGAERRVALYGA